jgi:hypothetical protein
VRPITADLVLVHKSFEYPVTERVCETELRSILGKRYRNIAGHGSVKNLDEPERESHDSPSSPMHDSPSSPMIERQGYHQTVLPPRDDDQK